MLLNNTGVKIIESDMKNNNLIPFLLGAPGIGKSSIVGSICKKNGWGFHELLCNQIAMQADLTGCRTMSYKGANGEDLFKQVFFPHAVVQEAIEEAKANPNKIVVLFLDEVNRTTAAVTSALLTFITARTIGTEKLPENIKLIAAGNDDGNVITLDQASISRFILRHCEPDASVFLGLGKIHPVIEDILKQQPALIYQCKNAVIDGDDDAIYAEEENEFQQIATPRTIMGLNKALLDNSQMVMSMPEQDLKEYVAGFTGDTLFTEAIVTAIMANKFKLVTPNKVEAPARPACIDMFLNVSKLTDIQSIVANMSDEERSSAILYMLYDTTTNYTNYMPELINAYGKNMLMNGEMQKLTTIYNSGEYNRDAYDLIVNSQCALGQSFQMIYGS
jgi:hypothetical protein